MYTQSLLCRAIRSYFVTSWLNLYQSSEASIFWILWSLVKPVLSKTALPCWSRLALACPFYIRSSACIAVIFLLVWQPPAFPYRHQYSIIGRFRLNHRVRDVDGCFPKAYRHQKYPELYCPKQSARFRSASSRCAASPHLRFQTQSLVSKLTVFSFVRYIASHYYHINNSTVNNLYSISLERRWSSRTFRYGYLVTTSPQLSNLPSAAPSLRLGHWLRAFPTPMVWRAVCTRPGNVFTAAFWSAITSDSSFV